MAVIYDTQKYVALRVLVAGPESAGKTTLLGALVERLVKRGAVRGRQHGVGRADQEDFEFVGMGWGVVAGYRVQLHVVSSPGGAFDVDVRHLLAKEVDAVIVVVPAEGDVRAGRRAVDELRAHLRDHDLALDRLPVILAVNRASSKGTVPEGLTQGLGIPAAIVVAHDSVTGLGVDAVIDAIETHVFADVGRELVAPGALPATRVRRSKDADIRDDEAVLSDIARDIALSRGATKLGMKVPVPEARGGPNTLLAPAKSRYPKPAARSDRAFEREQDDSVHLGDLGAELSVALGAEVQADHAGSMREFSASEKTGEVPTLDIDTALDFEGDDFVEATRVGLPVPAAAPAAWPGKVALTPVKASTGATAHTVADDAGGWRVDTCGQPRSIAKGVVEIPITLVSASGARATVDVKVAVQLPRTSWAAWFFGCVGFFAGSAALVMHFFPLGLK